MTPKKRKTVRAALIIIGDEILSGRTKDKNIAFLAERLTALGIRLHHVRIVPDEEGEIIEAVNGLRASYDYVFTTGGIGPTHDDITAATIAKAFGRKVERHAGAMRALKKHYSTEQFTDARKTMADMPRDVTLIDNPVSAAPGFIIENVYVMAGVPEIMQGMFDGIADTLKGGKPLKQKTISCNIREGDIAPHLSQIQKNYDRVTIGSYPFFHDGNVGVSVVMRSEDEIQLQRAAKEVREAIDILNDRIAKGTL